jgi:ActR/RegA family two-component response regulator
MDRPEAPEVPLATVAERSPVDALIGARATSVEVERAARGMLLKSLHVECEGNVSEIARRADLSRKVVRTELALLGTRQPMKPWKRLTRKKTG